VCRPAGCGTPNSCVSIFPQAFACDDRPGALAGNTFGAGNHGEAGQFLHGYRSAWLPASLLEPERQRALADALFAASRQWDVTLHFNKGLAGAPAAERRPPGTRR
jgi:hypothetical protein